MNIDLKDGQTGGLDGYVWKKTSSGWRYAPEYVERQGLVNHTTKVCSDSGVWLDKPISSAFVRDCEQRSKPGYKYTSPGQFGA